MILETNFQPGFGLSTERIARNGGLTDGSRMTQLMVFANMLASRRLHCLASGGNSIGNFVAGGVTGAGRCTFHTSPNCAGVEAVMVCGRASSATAFGNVVWVVVDGGSDVFQGDLFTGGSTAGTNGPDDLIVVKLRFVDAGGDQLAGDTTYSARFTTSAAVVVLSWNIYEIPRSSLDTALHTASALSPDVFGHGAPILDRDITKVTDLIWKLYRRAGVSQVYWMDTTGFGASQTGATWKNVLDNSTAGYSATAAGFWTIPYRKNRLASTGVDVVLWAWGGGGFGPSNQDGEVRFTNSAGVIGTITGMGPGPALYTTTAQLNGATGPTSDLVVIEHRHADGGTEVVSTMSAGIYEFLT